MADQPVLEIRDIPNRAWVLSPIDRRYPFPLTRLRWLADDRIVCSSQDDTIQIWDTMNRKQVGISMQHEGPINNFVVTKDGRIISQYCPRFSFNNPQFLTVWQAATQKRLSHQHIKEPGLVNNFTLSENTDVLVTCHTLDLRNRTLIFWDVAGTPQVKIPALSLGEFAREARIEVCFCPDGKKLAVLRSTDSVAWITIFDVQSGQRIFVSPELEGDESIGPGNLFIWSSDGSRFFYGLSNGLIRCLDSSTCEIIWDSPKGINDNHHVSHISQSPNGKWLVSGSSRSDLIGLKDIESGAPVGQALSVKITYPFHLPSIDFSPSGEFIACIDNNRCIAIIRVPWWDHDDDDQLVPTPILDLSAVISSDSPSNLPPEPDIDFIDASPRRSVLPRDRPTHDSSARPVRVRYSPFSGSWWKNIPRLRFIRDLPNPVYLATAPPRSHVASRESVQNTRHSAPSPSSAPIPEHDSDQDPTVTVDMPSVSSSSRDESSNRPDSDLDVHHIGCCGLLSNRHHRRQLQVDAATGSSSPTTQPPADSTYASPSVPHASSSRAVDHSILEISAVVRSDADAA